MIHRAGGLTTNGGTDGALPACALIAGSSTPLKLYVVEISLATSTSARFALRRLTTAGTPGSTITSIPDDPDAAASSGLLKDSYSSTAPTLTAGNMGACQLGAAVGSAWTWVFEKGLDIREGTANGIGVVPIGAGQQIVAHYVWEE
jgi:hypothetical protein